MAAHHLGSWFSHGMRSPWIPGRKVGVGLVGCTSPLGVGHGVVDFEDQAPRTEVSELFLLVALLRRKGRKNVFNFGPREVEELASHDGVDFRAEPQAGIL